MFYWWARLYEWWPRPPLATSWFRPCLYQYTNIQINKLWMYVIYRILSCQHYHVLHSLQFSICSRKVYYKTPRYKCEVKVLNGLMRPMRCCALNEGAPQKPAGRRDGRFFPAERCGSSSRKRRLLAFGSFKCRWSNCEAPGEKGLSVILWVYDQEKPRCQHGMSLYKVGLQHQHLFL